MQWYSLIKQYYEAGYYTEDNVKVFLVAGKITVEQFEAITSENYEAS